MKMAVIRNEPLTIEAANQKAFSELEWKSRLNSYSEYKDEPMEICHSRRQVQIEAVSPTTTQNDNKTRYKKNN